jgi:hypothetical protein
MCYVIIRSDQVESVSTMVQKTCIRLLHDDTALKQLEITPGNFPCNFPSEITVNISALNKF